MTRITEPKPFDDISKEKEKCRIGNLITVTVIMLGIGAIFVATNFSNRLLIADFDKPENHPYPEMEFCYEVLMPGVGFVILFID